MKRGRWPQHLMSRPTRLRCWLASFSSLCTTVQATRWTTDGSGAPGSHLTARLRHRWSVCACSQGKPDPKPPPYGRDQGARSATALGPGPGLNGLGRVGKWLCPRLCPPLYGACMVRAQRNSNRRAAGRWLRYNHFSSSPVCNGHCFLPRLSCGRSPSSDNTEFGANRKQPRPVPRTGTVRGLLGWGNTRRGYLRARRGINPGGEPRCAQIFLLRLIRGRGLQHCPEDPGSQCARARNGRRSGCPEMWVAFATR